VPDTLRALQDLAAWWRARIRSGVSGSPARPEKTIAKEIVADVSGAGLVPLRNEGNLNSETGPAR
jgi:hypothetical protein